MEVGDVSVSKAMLEVMQIEQTQQSIALSATVSNVSVNNQEEQISTLLRNLEAITTGIGLCIDTRG